MMCSSHAMLGLWCVLVPLFSAETAIVGVNSGKNDIPWCSRPGVHEQIQSIQDMFESTKKIFIGICSHIGSRERSRRPSKDRWTPKVEKALGPGLRLLQELLGDAQGPDQFRVWNNFAEAVKTIAEQSEFDELQAYLAAVHEYIWNQERQLFWALGRFSWNTGLPRMPDHAVNAIRTWIRAGRIDEATRFFYQLRGVESSSGMFPFQYFFDNDDIRRTSSFPLLGLPANSWVDPHQVLPVGVASLLESNWRAIAMDAQKLVQRLTNEPDAYPGINKHQQWTKLDIYNAVEGWQGSMCETMRSLCSILQGKMRSEGELRRHWLDTHSYINNDEMVILFRVSSTGLASLHSGQDGRINVHLCVLNCNHSSIYVAGEKRHYYDGSLFAFEDRADHEIINEGLHDRIMVGIGVLRPEIDPDGQPHVSYATTRLQFITSSLAVPGASLPREALGEGLIIASAIGKVSEIKLLLENGAPIDFADADGVLPIQAASNMPSTVRHDVLRVLLRAGADANVRDSEKVTVVHRIVFAAVQGKVPKLKRVLKMMVKHCADVDADGPYGSPSQMLEKVNRLDLLPSVNAARETSHDHREKCGFGDRQRVDTRGHHDL